MYRHHSKDEKLKAISLYRDGFSNVAIGNMMDINDSIIRRWVNSHHQLGDQFFDKQPNVRATPEFKVKVVREVIEKHLSCEQVALQYGVSKSAVESWVGKVRDVGYDSLFVIKPRGRPPKNMGRPKKREPQTELEKLRYEVEYLRTENALLKKVRALVEERIARESGKKLTPSKH